MVRRPRWECGLLLAVLVHVSGDVIFRVPEVVVRHAAASKPVGTVSNGTSSRAVSAPLLEVRYEEYFVEHDVSALDAKKAARELNLDEIPATRPGCGTCSRRELEYCETRLLADHCCCEQRFLPEPFPWLPHTCYMGPSRCRPLAHDCAKYARLRDCCCFKKIAERWKAILSKSSRVGVSGILLLLSTLLFTYL